MAKQIKRYNGSKWDTIKLTQNSIEGLSDDLLALRKLATTVNATNSTKQLFLTGTLAQGTEQNTYTNQYFSIQDNALYAPDFVESGERLSDKYASKEELDNAVKETVSSKHRLITGIDEGLAVKDQQMLIPTIQGRTVVMNQLVKNQGTTAVKDYNGIAWHIEGYEIFINGTLKNGSVWTSVLKEQLYLIKEHYYYVTGRGLGLWAEGGFAWDISLSDECGIFKNTFKDGFFTYQFMLGFSNETEKKYDNYKTFLQVIDLTQMFGSGNEPTDVNDDRIKWIKSKGYIPYNKGTIVNSRNDLVSTGVNICSNVLWEKGLAIVKDGTHYNERCVGSREFIPIEENSYCSISSYKGETWRQLGFYDKNKNQIGYTDDENVSVFETPKNCCYIRVSLFFTDIQDLIIPQNFMINYGKKLLPFKPYQKDTLLIDRELGKWDYIDNVNNKKVVRTGEVDLGTLDWTYNSEAKYFRAKYTFNTIVGNGTESIKKDDGLCSKYDYLGFVLTANLKDKSIGKTVNSEKVLFIKDLNYTTPNELKLSLKGVKLIYELETPIITDLIIPNGISVYNGGIQEQTGEVPYELTRKYALSIGGQVSANIDIDKDQQTQLDDLYNKTTNLEDFKVSANQDQSTINGVAVFSNDKGTEIKSTGVTIDSNDNMSMDGNLSMGSSAEIRPYQKLIFNDTSNPYVKMTTNNVPFYLQATAGQIGLGPTWGNATKWDNNGNMSVAGDISEKGTKLADKYLTLNDLGTKTFKTEYNNEMNAYTNSGNLYLNYRGGNSVLILGSGNGSETRGTFKAGTIEVTEQVIAKEFVENETKLADKYVTLQGGTEIKAGQDLNNLETPGNYYCEASSIAKQLGHIPNTDFHAFTLKVAYSTGKGVPSQEIVEYNSQKRYWRVKVDNTIWSSWREVAFISDLPTDYINNVTATLGTNRPEMKPSVDVAVVGKTANLTFNNIKGKDGGINVSMHYVPETRTLEIHYHDIVEEPK